MGYYTDYKITINSDDKELLEALNEKIEEIAEYWGTLRGNIIFFHCKWYDHEDHMREVSKSFPNLVITVNGDGEESGDVWRRYYKNGKCQYASTKIVFAEFDESQLE